MAVAAIVLNPSNATEFDITHRNLYQMRRREAKEVCSVSCCGKPDSSKPGHDRVLSRLVKASHLEPHQGSEKASFEIFEEQLGNFCFKFIYPEEYERLSLRYQSLHTVVMKKENIPLEIQVRTREMDSQAEFGLAAHWRYKQEQGSMKIV